MPSDFVRYSPDIETFDPKLSEYMTRIIDFWETKVRESPTAEGSGRAVRGAHAKTIGVVRAEVQILSEVPPAYAQGIYAQPGRHDALIRFSSASNHLGPDAQLGPVLGFAIKIFDVAGTKLVEDEPDATTFDLVLKNHPTFIANTAKHYLFIQEIGDQVGNYVSRGQAGFHQLLADFVTGKGTLEQSDWAWEELFAFVKTAAQTPVRNPLLNPYYTMAAVRHGDYVAKIRVAPVAESAENVIHRQVDLSSGPDVYGPTLVDELQARGFDFDLQVQLCTDLKTMPVNDATVEWPENAVAIRDGRTCTSSTPGHFGAGESREGRRPCVQSVARDGRSPAAGRNHGRAAHLYPVSENPPHSQSPTTGRACHRGRGADATHEPSLAERSGGEPCGCKQIR